MLNIYARSFQEATRFSASTRPDPVTQRYIETVSASGNVSLFNWLRRLARLLALKD
ncbi:hypothetical protein [Labrenzia sp. OB1]|uniref:hypothetical protein n=1 Tax=Labrenzia sp. OB1 TaxID=1561204 RepID=UPI000B0CD4D2|nr:hypothetical protein [Labrenzia sp. OB1]